MVLARSSRDIDQKNAIGNYEFTLTPRALFAPSGAMLPCTDKSKLIHALERLATAAPSSEDEDIADMSAESQISLVMPQKIAVVDAMVVVQKMTKKPPTMATVLDLSQSFNDRG